MGKTLITTETSITAEIPMIYRYDDKGKYIDTIPKQIDWGVGFVDGKVVYRECPNSTDIAPVLTDGMVAYWVNDHWEYNRDYEKEIANCKEYLSSTDYIDNKILESTLLGEDITALVERYRPTLIQRKQARDRINELEAEMTLQDKGEANG